MHRGVRLGLLASIYPMSKQHSLVPELGYADDRTLLLRFFARLLGLLMQGVPLHLVEVPLLSGGSHPSSR